MESVASQLIEKVTAHAQRDSLEDAREICADGAYFPNNLRNYKWSEMKWMDLKRNDRSLKIEESEKQGVKWSDVKCSEDLWCNVCIIMDL